MREGKLALENPFPRRDFLYINDAAAAFVKAINSEWTGCHIYNVGSGKSYSVTDVVNIIAKILDKKTDFVGLFCILFSTVVILSTGQVFFSASYNSSLFSVHGTLVCLGLILYSIGAKAIPAAELTLLSLTEVIGGIFWVWLPILGINEIPDSNTIAGGFFIFISLVYYSLVMSWNKRFIALN